jgi:hypothetical protein
VAAIRLLGLFLRWLRGLRDEVLCPLEFFLEAVREIVRPILEKDDEAEREKNK